jgi:hypothetical protein
LWIAEGAIVLSPGVVPLAPLLPNEIGVLVGCERAGDNTAANVAQFGVWFAHDCGDPAPASEMSENFISNSKLLDGDVALPGADVGSGLEAWVAPNDEIHASTPSSSVEGSHVAPDRSRIHPPFCHARDQEGGGKGFPLHVHDDARREACSSES